jgi:hypothetical protein
VNTLDTILLRRAEEQSDAAVRHRYGPSDRRGAVDARPAAGRSDVNAILLRWMDGGENRSAAELREQLGLSLAAFNARRSRLRRRNRTDVETWVAP